MKRTILAAVALTLAGCGTSNAAISEIVPAEGGDSSEFESTVPRAPATPTASVSDLATGFNQAGIDLFLEQDPAANTVLSPLSIGHALLMAEAAADEPTRAALADTFSFPTDAHDAWNTLDLTIDASNGSTINVNQEPTPLVTVAARVWPRTGFAPSPGWTDLMASNHGAGTESIDVSDAEGSADRINAWISDETNGLIDDLVKPSFVTPSTVLILTDAVYFEAEWAQIFGKYGTTTHDFKNLDGTTTSVEFNRDLEQPGPRGAGDGFTAAEMPYRGGDYSMLLIVPDEGQFEAVHSRLSGEFIAEVDTVLTNGPWELELPEWETETSIDFFGWLTQRQIAPGNFPAFGEGVFLGGAVHGANIAVDDMGTVAAAATALGFEESGPPEPELTLRVDRPFLYMIRHVESGAVMFLGQVVQL